MTIKSEQFVDLIFKKLKRYKHKEIFLEKENLERFIFSLFKDQWNQIKIPWKQVYLEK